MSEDEKSERRSIPDSTARNRRVIARVTDLSIRPQMQLIRMVSLAWVWISVAYVAALLVIEAPKLGAHLTRVLFIAVVVGTMAVMVYRLSRGATSFLENDSQARLTAFAEKVYLVILSGTVVLTLLGIAHIITLL